MPFSHLHYLPLSPPYFSALVLLFLVLVALIRLGVIQHIYTRLGIGSMTALSLLLLSLLGSYVNIPVAKLPGDEIVSGQVVSFYGMHYTVPVVTAWPATIVAVNVGGALIPGLMSLYLLIRVGLWGRGLIAIAGVAGFCYWLAQTVPGIGIAVPVFAPALATAVLAILLSRQHTAALAYIGGSLGTLVGADLFNLGNLQGLGAPVVSIGGAGTFDGIFVTGILAVLIASLAGGAGGSQPTLPKSTD